MTEKRQIIKANVLYYSRANKKEKGKMLDELTQITGYSRKYLTYLLNIGKKRIKINKGLIVKADLLKTEVHKRGRKRIYPLELKPHLLKIWKLANLISSKHLKAFIEENREWIFEGEEFSDITEREIELICSMSSATIERMLKEEKRKQRSLFKYKQRSSVSNHIKKQIEIESFYDRKVDRVGYIEVDLVHHSGNSGKGEFFYTLTAVDVKSDWTSLRLLKNKARIWTYEALSGIFRDIPYVPYHLHSDNGSEFINSHIISFIKDNKIEQTRSRAYRKNDNALVELKNWTMVRAYTGYRRYNTKKEYEILSKLLSLIELKHNLFIPTMKIVKKEYKGKKAKRRYETKTPLSRLLQSEDISENKKRELIELKKSVNLYKLTAEMAYLLDELDKAYNNKHKSNKNFALDLSLKTLNKGAL